MHKAVIVDCIRSPMGRAKQGCFRYTRAEALSGAIIKGLLKRNARLPLKHVEDVYWGCVQQTLEQGFNIARNSALLAGLPTTSAAVTVNRLCGSSMQAVHDAARAIMLNDGKAFIAGGVEHMGHVPMHHGIDFAPQLNHHIANASSMMGHTAELLAKQYEITREQMDRFALRSHSRASAADTEGRFDEECYPVLGHNEQGALSAICHDEVIRHNCQLNELTALSPVFDKQQGHITAGNASALSDGAAALLLMSQSHADSLGLPIRAQIRAMAVSGCNPAIMGIGPVNATQKALQRANLSLNDIDVIELNEAFAGQALACIKALKLNDCYESKLNLNGGAIALGHPLGCSGARILTSLVNIMEQQQARLGLACMCIGLGQGIATIIERTNTPYSQHTTHH